SQVSSKSFRQTEIVLMISSVFVGVVVWFSVNDWSLITPTLPLTIGERPTEVCQYYIKSGRAHPDDPFRVLYAADALIYTGNYAEAREFYNRDIKLFEQRNPDRMRTVMLALAQQRAAQACDVLGKKTEAAELRSGEVQSLNTLLTSLAQADP